MRFMRKVKIATSIYTETISQLVGLQKKGKIWTY